MTTKTVSDPVETPPDLSELEETDCMGDIDDLFSRVEEVFQGGVPDRLRAVVSEASARLQPARDRLTAIRREVAASPRGRKVRVLRNRVKALEDEGESHPGELAEARAKAERAWRLYQAAFQARVGDLRKDLLDQAEKREGELVNRLVEMATDIGVEIEKALLERQFLAGSEFTEARPIDP